MKKNRDLDYFLIFSIVFITVFGVYIIYKQIEQEKLNTYLDTLHNTVASLMDKSDSTEYEAVFAAFSEKVQNNEIEADEIETFADKLIQLKKERAQISPLELEQILPEESTRNKHFIAKILPAQSVDWEERARSISFKVNRIDSLIDKEVQNEIIISKLQSEVEFHSNLSDTHKQKNMEQIKAIEVISATAANSEELERMLLKRIELIKKENIELIQKIKDIERLEDKVKAQKKSLSQ